MNQEELDLRPEEMISLAKRVSHWTKVLKDEDGWKKDYTGCYFGVHFTISRQYDPNPYEGHGIHIALTASLDNLRLGECNYDFQRTEGTVDYDQGVKELETFVDSIDDSLPKEDLCKNDAWHTQEIYLQKKNQTIIIDFLYKQTFLNNIIFI